MSKAPLPVSTDVLIIGAGPVGLTLSAALALEGVDHLTIERNESVATGSKAGALQPRTLEYLDSLGVAEALIAAGDRGDGFTVYDTERALLHLGYDKLDTPYPFILQIDQQTTEEILQDHAVKAGARIQRGYRLLDWAAESSTLVAIIAGPDGTVRAVRARYLVGADGVFSTVRRRAGIPFSGTSPDGWFALADFRLAGGISNTDAAFFTGRAGMVLVAGLPSGLHRLAAPVPPGTVPQDAAAVQALLRARAGDPYRHAEVAEVITATIYQVQERVADRFVDGQVVLVGDAAHTHAPAGAQGLNTGIQDAANLAWRLAEICCRGADRALLAGYHDERYPVAGEVIAFTGQLAALTMIRDPQLARLRDAMLEAAANVPEAVEWLTRRMAQLSVGYTIADAGPTPGTRLDPRVMRGRPDRPRWVLADPDATGTTEKGRLLVIPAPELSGTVLVRPDGYVEAVGLDAVRAEEHLLNIAERRR